VNRRPESLPTLDGGHPDGRRPNGRAGQGIGEVDIHDQTFAETQPRTRRPALRWCGSAGRVQLWTPELAGRRQLDGEAMIESRSAATAVELKRRIVQGLIPPGARLSERSISRGLNVSRTPLREALLQLESERLVERTPTGAWQAPRLTERDVRDIFAVRKQLEVLAVRLTIERASDAEVATLEEYLTASEEAHEAVDIVSMNFANGGFHSAMYRSAHSSWLTTAIEPIRSQTIRIRFLIASHVAGPEYSEGHRQIYDALVKRNVNTAEAIVSDHVDQDLKVAVRHLSVLAGPPGLFYYTESDVRSQSLTADLKSDIASAGSSTA